MPAGQARLKDRLAQAVGLRGWVSTPEQEQGILRIGISIAFLAYLLLSWPEPGQASGLSLDVFNVLGAFLLYSMLLFVATLVWPDHARVHRVVGICVDIAVFSYGLHITGALSAPWYGVYLWVTLGNGFRYGEKYLYLSGAASLLGFGAVVLTTPYWHANIELAVGLTATLLVIPAYSALLIRRLNEARRRADSASRAKSDFLSRMSHEIRTPLNGILGMTDLLRTRPLDPEDREYVETIHASGKALAAQIDEILDLSKIEAGQLSVEKIEFDLYALINTTLRIFEPQVAAKQLRLQEAINPATPFLLQGDPHKLRQVIINLVGNALKFTDQGIVSLRVYPREQEADRVLLRFEVADTGRGIPADRLQAIFEPFAQADSSVARRHGGTGLGTTICRHLVELMGGRIGVQSDPDTGTTFWFDLPFDVAAPQMSSEAAQAWVDECRIVCLTGREGHESAVVSSLRDWGIPFTTARSVSEALALIGDGSRFTAGFDGLLVDRAEWSDELAMLLSHLERVPLASRIPVVLAGCEDCPSGVVERSAESLFVLPAPVDRRVLFNMLHACYSRHSTEDDVIHIARHQVREQRMPRQLNVLIGDDNATNRLVLERMLLKTGCRCTAVSGGVEVLTALEHSRFDVVIVDKNMPDMGGIDVFSACSMAHGGRLPAKFIILTADATAEARDACAAAGIEYFLTKPVSMDRLQEMLGRAMSGTEPAGEAVESFSSPLQDAASLPVVDDGVFAQLEVLAGDNRCFMREMIDNFEKDARRDIRCLETAVAGHDWRAFMDCAHALKGAAMYLGLSRLARLGAEAQKLSRQDFDRYGVAWLQEIREACATGLAALNDKLSASRRSGHGPA